MEQEAISVQEAGVLPAMYNVKYQLGFDSYVLVTATYTGICPKLERSSLYCALKQVIKEQPALCVRLSQTPKGNLHWIRLPAIDLDTVVVFSPDASDKLANILTKDFSDRHQGDTLWRLIVLKDNTVVFSFHHAIGDGRSGMAFHRSLLRALNALPFTEPQKIDAIVTTDADIELAAPVEDVIDVSTSLTTIGLMFLQNRVFPRSWNPATYAWTGNPSAPEPHRRAHARLHSIAPGDAKSLLSLCRAHNCTLTGFIHTLTVLALSSIVHNINASGKDDTRYSSLSFITAIDLRTFTGCSADLISAQASGHPYFVPLMDAAGSYPLSSSSFPWKAAADFNGTLQMFREKSKEVIGLLRFLFKRRNPSEFYLGKLSQKRERTVSLSNLGRFAPEPESPGSTNTWKIGEMFFCAFDAAIGPTFTVSTVGSPSGTVNTIYSWGDGAVDEEIAEEFVARMKEGVAAVLSS